MSTADIDALLARAEVEDELPEELCDRVVATGVTLAEFDALPDDPTLDRMLMRGDLWERPMTVRNRWHSSSESRIAALLDRWLEETGHDGVVLSGEAGVERPDADSRWGVDVMYCDGKALAATPADANYIRGVPKLVVEILSTADSFERINAKAEEFFDLGVPMVWIVDPKNRSVVVRLADGSAQHLREPDTLDGGDVLPGFAVVVGKIFDRKYVRPA
ncbi:MAG: Uma2 family endonuclease [Planctomycetota bacterium]